MTAPSPSAPYRRYPRSVQSIGGAFNAACGLFLCGLAGYLLFHERLYAPGVAFLSPAQLVMGLALIAFPTYKNERLDRGESLEGLEGWRLLTPRWRAVVVVALASGAAYAAALWLMR